MRTQQRKTSNSDRTTANLPRQIYAAAVRFTDGSRDIFHVLNANDLDDARDLVLSELDNVRSLVISARH